MRFLDTNILVDFLRGRLAYGYGILRESDPSQFKVPSMVQAELLLGAEKSRDAQRNRVAVECLLRPFEIVPFDASCARHYAATRAYLERRGTPIGPADLVIAATTLAHGAVLVTNNDREFARVPNLSIESWHEVDLPARPSPAERSAC